MLTVPESGASRPVVPQVLRSLAREGTSRALDGELFPAERRDLSLQYRPLTRRDHRVVAITIIAGGRSDPFQGFLQLLVTHKEALALGEVGELLLEQGPELHVCESTTEGRRGRSSLPTITAALKPEILVALDAARLRGGGD